MTKKMILLALCSLLLASSSAVEAQQPAKIPRIGYFAGTADRNNPTVEAFRQGLRDLGYTEGKNIQLEFRYTEGRPDPASNLVAELVQLKVDVLVITQGQAAIREAQQPTKTIPIVMVTTVIRWPPGSSIAWRIQAETSRGSLHLLAI